MEQKKWKRVVKRRLYKLTGDTVAFERVKQLKETLWLSWRDIVMDKVDLSVIMSEDIIFKKKANNFKEFLDE